VTPQTPCGKCGSTEVIPKARVIDGRDYIGPVQSSNLEIGVARKPYAFVFTGEQRSEVIARVCGKCGFIELYAEDPGVLHAAHLEALERSK
jgi:predicted nucleic-acid-binding Zn-ribbon protein